MNCLRENGWSAGLTPPRRSRFLIWVRVSFSLMFNLGRRGLLGFAAHPNFARNGLFWVWYSAIEEHTASPADFFQWLVSTSAPWDQSQWDHVEHLEEYRVVGGVPVFQRTLLKLKRPYFNHTGFQSLAWSPELQTLVLGLGDGGHYQMIESSVRFGSGHVVIQLPGYQESRGVAKYVDNGAQHRRRLCRGLERWHLSQGFGTPVRMGHGRTLAPHG